MVERVAPHSVTPRVAQASACVVLSYDMHNRTQAEACATTTIPAPAVFAQPPHFLLEHPRIEMSRLVLVSSLAAGVTECRLAEVNHT